MTRLRCDEPIRYSWWSYRGQARANNVGWRIDYFLASESLKSRMQSADIHCDVTGSDHCPIELITDH
jgi:exodeoxyribonuclease-3